MYTATIAQMQLHQSPGLAIPPWVIPETAEAVQVHRVAQFLQCAQE